jgi:uncharacterized protein (TIGR00730 family)
VKAVCVFCGSSSGNRPVHTEIAASVGRLLAARQLPLVYGGGRVGLMGTVADAALAAGGEVIGIIPRALADREVAHQGLTQLHVVDSMHVRKAMMAEMSDAFVALPGGFGTLEEFCEIVTWCQLGIHRKPCCLLNVDGYYDSLIEQFDVGVEQQFIKPEHRAMILAAADPETLLSEMANFQPPVVDKWLTDDER